MSTVPTFVICPICDRSPIALRKDGVMRHHVGNEPEFPGAPFRKRCPGAGMTVEQARVAGEKK